MVFGQNLDHWVLQRPLACAIEFRPDLGEPTRIGYRRFAQLVKQAERDLLARGLGRGDRIAWLAWNHPALIVLIYAAARQGIAVVTLNYRLTAHELNHPLIDARPSLLWIDRHVGGVTGRLALADADCTTIPLEQWWQDRLDQSTDAPDSEHLSRPGCLDDDLLIVYSSGTTGKPKGVVLTQRALWFNNLNSIHAHDLTSQDKVLVALPTFHVGGLNIMLLPALQMGAQVILMERFDPESFLLAIHLTRPTLSILVPAVIRALINHPQWLRTSLASLRMLNAGSSIIAPELIEAIHARGIPLGQVYGSTETAPIAIYLRAEDAVRKAGSTGLPALYCEARLCHDGQPVDACGQVGEIQIRGPNLLRTYLNLPEATSLSLIDGWYATGDLAYRDEEGYYWVVGRAREMIISGGENIYPAEVEALLEHHPAIEQAAVVGLPDSQWGEVVSAAITIKPGHQPPTLGDLQAFMQTTLARFKQPRQLFILESLPKTALGKVQKTELVDLLRSRFTG